jgi:hypothetical protein
MRNAALVLAAALAAGGAFGADRPKDAKDGKPISAAGIMTDTKGESITIWTDGEDEPVTYLLADRFDKKTLQGIFTISRVRFAYTKDGDSRKLLAIRKERPLAGGTVTGTVLFSNDFWLVVKPKAGPPDGYALGAAPENAGLLGKRLKAVQKGDTVTLRFHTDFERHRIDALMPRLTHGDSAEDALSRSWPSQGPAYAGPAI